MKMFKEFWFDHQKDKFEIIKLFLNSALDLTVTSIPTETLFLKTFDKTELAEFFIECLRFNLKNMLSFFIYHLVTGNAEVYAFMTRNVICGNNILHKCASESSLETIERLLKIAESNLSISVFMEK